MAGWCERERSICTPIAALWKLMMMSQQQGTFTGAQLIDDIIVYRFVTSLSRHFYEAMAEMKHKLREKWFEKISLSLSKQHFETVNRAESDNYAALTAAVISLYQPIRRNFNYQEICSSFNINYCIRSLSDFLYVSSSESLFVSETTNTNSSELMLVWAFLTS